MFNSLLSKLLENKSNALLANRYQLMTQLGQGAMGQVYKAIDQKSGDTVAIKFLAQTLLKKKMLDRFEKEAKISALLGEQNEHIVKVKDYGLIDNQIPFYVMEYLEGYDLADFLKQKTMSVGQFLHFSRQICLGLECAHNGILVNHELATIIHRDIKPSNIFLARDQQKRIICKILDFGIAQIHDSEQEESQKSFMGTLKYSAPEQLAEGEVKITTDIYSLGILMYEMLTKKTPIVSDNNNYPGWFKAHHEMTPKPIPRYIQLPDEAKKIIMRCLEKSPDRRPQTVGEILRIITPLERQFNNKTAQLKINNGSTSNLRTSTERKAHNTSQEQTNSGKILLPLEQIYQESTWPEDKPQQKIVFPYLTEAKEGAYTSLWAMLDKSEVERLEPRSTLCFNHFLYQLQPHPLILWINLLYQREQEPKWLKCYLDLKTKQGYQISCNLVDQERYYILLFELGNPEQYQQLLTMQIAQKKINQLNSFVQQSSAISSSVDGAKQSKLALNQQFEQMKSKILNLFETSKK